MRFQMRKIFARAAIAAVMFCGTRAQAVRGPRIELLRAVQVNSESVLLSDLLPQNGPGSLRTRATEISLGAAPQLGSTRTLEGPVLLSHMSDSEDILSEIAIPDRIVVSRESRAITVPEVFEAIRKALERSGIRAAGTLQLQDILLQSQVFVSPGDAGLQVMRMDFDAGLRRARFLLWPSRNPRVVPFFATARLDGDSPLAEIHLGADRERSMNRPGISSTLKTLATQQFLVAPGERATLHLLSNTLQMYADVDPLERGTLGQDVRVRVLDTGKIFKAKVDGRAHLELKF